MSLWGKGRELSMTRDGRIRRMLEDIQRQRPMSARPSHEECERIEENARCPICDYRLQGLSEPRCPECGESFEWDDLRRPLFRCHRYLYEDQDGVRSSFSRACLTYLAAHFPARFWQSIVRERPIRRDRLARFCLGAICFGLMATSGIVIARNTSVSYAAARDLAARGVAAIGPWYTLITLPNILQIASYILPLILWPILSVMSILAFRGSLKRAEVQAVEVVRCIVYALPLFNSVWAIFLACTLFVLEARHVLFACLCVIVVWCWSLRCGLRY